MVEVNPLIKNNDEDVQKTVFSATRGILSFFGYKTLGTHNPRGNYLISLNLSFQPFKAYISFLKEPFPFRIDEQAWYRRLK